MRIFYAGLFLVAAVLLLTPFSGCSGNASFEKLDTDGDDHITAAEVPDAEKERVGTLFKGADKNNDGKLTRQEYSAATRTIFFYLAAFAVIVAVVGVPFFTGNKLAQWIRMPDYGWKIGVILLSLVLAIIVTTLKWPPELGVDLSGGVILIYEINEEATLAVADAAASDDQEQDKDQEPPWWKWFVPGAGQGAAFSGDVGSVDPKDMVVALGRRINPGGVREIIIRPYGERQVEIIIPRLEADEVDHIKQLIVKSGFLKFLIVANPQAGDPAHNHLVAVATGSQANPEATVIREGNKIIGRWVKVVKDESGAAKTVPEGVPCGGYPCWALCAAR